MIRSGMSVVCRNNLETNRKVKMAEKKEIQKQKKPEKQAKPENEKSASEKADTKQAVPGDKEEKEESYLKDIMAIGGYGGLFRFVSSLIPLLF